MLGSTEREIFGLQSVVRWLLWWPLGVVTKSAGNPKLNYLLASSRRKTGGVCQASLDKNHLQSENLGIYRCHLPQVRQGRRLPIPLPCGHALL